MILDLCTQVSSLELIKNTTNYLTADHLRYPTNKYTQLEAGTRFIVTTNDLMQFLPNDNTLTDLQNDTDNLATYNGVLNLVNPNSRTQINQGTDYLTNRNQISDWIETAYATAVVSNTDHLVTTGFCDIKYATTTALSTLQGEVSTSTLAISNLQNQLIAVGIGAIVSGAFNFIDNIVSSALLSARIATCFKLGGSRTFTSNITSANDTYTFFGTVP